MAEILISEECIGCGSCVETCPDVFAMDATTGYAKVTTPASTAPCVDEAIDICPVRAISRG